MRRRAAVLVLIGIAAPVRALAHPGRPPEPHDLWTAWAWEPWIVTALLLSAWMYARGVERIWRRSGVGRT